MSLDNVNLNFVETTEDFLEFKRWLGQSRPILAVDVETSGFQWQAHDNARLVQFGDCDNGWAMPAQDWIGGIREVLREYKGPITGHNTRFDLHFLEKLCGFQPDWKNVHDTMIMAALLNSAGRKKLKILATQHIDPRAAQGEQILDDAFRRGHWDWATIPIDLPAYWQYGVLDTVLTARLWEKFDPWVHQAGLDDAYELECAAARPLYAMESHGFAVDLPYVDALEAKLRPFIAEAQAWVLDNWGISATSTNQLRTALLDLGAPLTKRTNKGKGKNLSTDEKVLTGLADNYPLAKIALEIRQASTICNNYLANFRKFAAPDGRIHAKINQMQARTHRMSINDPSMQNLGRGSLVRNSFLARPGYKLISCDFEQVEARIFADRGDVREMIDTINRGEDLHTFCAQMALGRDPTPKERQVFKTVTFTIIFGGGLEPVAVAAGLPLDEAKIFLNAYHAAFPRVKRWMKSVEQMGRAREENEGVAYIRTSDGSILSLSDEEEESRYYALTNYTIQGEAAVLFKRRLVSAQNAGLMDYMVLPVHDEIILEVPTAEAEEAGRVLEDAMTDLTTYQVPIAAKASKPVDRWGETK